MSKRNDSISRERKGDDKSRADKWMQAFGDQDAATLTVRQIERVLTDLQGDSYEPATCARYLTVLKAALGRGVRLRLLKQTLLLLSRP